jgi:hypothetical protein
MPSPISLARDRDDHVPLPPPAGESLADALRRTGSRPAGGAGGFLGWVVSAGLHVLVAILAFLVTWTVVRWTETPRDPVTASFESASFEPLASLSDLEPTSDPLTETTALESAVEESLEQALAEAAAGPLDLIAGTGRERAAAATAVGMVAETASFAGLRATNARTIVYVVDASGSMIGSFRTVLEELSRSLAGLVPVQSFAVIFFQRNLAIPVPPANRLVPASRAASQQAVEWATKNVIPSGRSNPVEALTRALALRPDCIFLLSSNITGAGQFEIDRADLLATLDRLNPLDSGTGRRRSQIQCIQFLDDDPLDTMRTIAERHGGEGGYKFLDRDELGLAAPEPPTAEGGKER